MQRLRTVIEQYSRWSELAIYVDRIAAHIESDFSHSLENAKALLETIGKEICKAKGQPLIPTLSVNAILKKAFRSLGYSSSDLVNKVSGALASIGQELGNLRNEISPTSHGRSMEELRERNKNVDLLTREFLVDSTVIVAVFLIRAFEDKEGERSFVVSGQGEARLEYPDAAEFNDFWDEAYGEFQMGDYAYSASEILFHVDHKAYTTEYAAFLEAKPEEEQGTGS